MSVQQLSAGQQNKEARINEITAGMAMGALFGRDLTVSGLSLKIQGGNLFPSGITVRWGAVSPVDTTLTLTDNASNYVVAKKSDGVISAATATTNWLNTTDYARVGMATTSAGVTTAYADHRLGEFGTHSQGAGGGGGGGDVVGPASAVDSRIALFDGTTGKLLKDGGVLLSALATQAYVDALLQGFSWKQAVRAATTANGTLATAFANGQSIDGVTLVTGNRILLKNQTTASENGIYTVNASGAPTRATDADAGAELVNATVLVSEGTTLADTQWTCTTNSPITPGTTALAFAQVSGGGGGASAFTALSDTPSSYSGNLGLPVMVNPGESALQFLGAPNGVSSSFTLAAADAVRTTRATAAVTITVPPNSSVAFPVGTIIPIRQTSSGTVTIVGGVGVTVNAPFQGSLLGAGAGALLVLEKVGTNEWDLTGDTARSASAITWMTPVTWTTGAAVDFTNIPSWVTEIIATYAGVSPSGTDAALLQIGDSGGIETTGYTSGFLTSSTSAAVAVAGSTSGAQVANTSPGTTSTLHGVVRLSRADVTSNQWVWQGTLFDPVAVRSYSSSGSKALSATLDRVRFAWSGSNTGDAGQVNIGYL